MNDNEVLGRLMGLSVMMDIGLMDRQDYEVALAELCNQYGTEYVAGMTVCAIFMGFTNLA